MSFRDRRKNRQAEDDAGDEPMNDVTLNLLQTITGGTTKTRSAAPLPVNAIVPTEDGALGFRAFRLTRIGLQSGDASYEDWMALGDFLWQVEGSLQWLIGDWIVMGESVYGQTYEQIAAVTGYAIPTLYDYAYVAANVQFSVRTENLSFGHHKLIAALSPEDQRYWLEQAAAGGWSISALRKALKPAVDGTGGDTRDEFATFASSQLKEAKKLDRPALLTRVSQLRELLTQLEQVLEKKR